MDRDQAFEARPLAIFGRVANTAHLALRQVLRAKERDQPLVVIDYQGAATALLDDLSRGNLHKAPLVWCDLANRRKPAAIFRMRRTNGLIPSVKALLARCAELGSNPLSDSTIDWVARFVWALSDRGTLGFSALLSSLSRPETLQWFRRELGATNEIDRLIELLGWLLRFPAVWCASEGNNPLSFTQVLTRGGTVWLEIPGQHFEKIEHQVVSHMAEAAVLDLLLSDAQTGIVTNTRRKVPIILYAFPAATPLSFRPEAAMAKHVGVFGLSMGHPMPGSARAWFDAKADCWIVGDVGRITSGDGCSCLNTDELARISTLKSGELWARAGSNGKAVTMRVRAFDHRHEIAHFHRRHNLKGRRITAVKQFSSAALTVAADSESKIDLYGIMCRKESLLGGWLRVKGHDRDSHGSDLVTISQFGSRIERELDHLADDLASGHYRCRPLRAVRIEKSDGGERVLKIACIRDQVAQATCLSLLEPQFEPRFSNFSFAYRPHRNAHHAVAFARSLIREAEHGRSPPTFEAASIP